MRKQILTLAMCLAIAGNSAIADVVKNSPAKSQPPSACPLGKAQPTPIAEPNIKKHMGKHPLMTREEAKKRFEERRLKEREMLYTDLCLSAEQKKKAEALDDKTKEGADKYIKKVQTEARKLRDLQKQKTSCLEIHKQKIALKEAKREMKNYFENSRKEFNSILTKDQQEKYKVINEAKRKEMEKYKKAHKHHKKMGEKCPRFEQMGPQPYPECKKGSMPPMGPPPEKIK